MPLELARAVASAGVEWAAPGLRQELVGELLASLPKALRRELQPFAPKVERIVAELQPQGPTLLHDLSRFLQTHFGVAVPVAAWRPEALPAHLRPRIEVLGGDRKAVAAGRDLDGLRGQLAAVKAAPAPESTAWQRQAAKWERVAITGWTFGDLPERLEVEDIPGHAVHAWPGLRVEDGAVCLRLFRSPEVARQESRAGVARLVELALQKDLGWLQRDLRSLA